MITHIALIRGINVGGNQMLPMKDLKQLLEKLGCTEVQTYIQSGNAVFCSSASEPASVAKRLAVAVAKGHGFEPRVLVLTHAELGRAAAANPFPEADENPKSVHLFFLAARPAKPDLKAMDALKTKTERYALKGTVFYLHTPDGFGTSKLAQRVERLLGVEATARNWNTVTKLLEMATASGHKGPDERERTLRASEGLWRGRTDIGPTDEFVRGLRKSTRPRGGKR